MPEFQICAPPVNSNEKMRGSSKRGHNAATATPNTPLASDTVDANRVTEDGTSSYYVKALVETSAIVRWHIRVTAHLSLKCFFVLFGFVFCHLTHAKSFQPVSQCRRGVRYVVPSLHLEQSSGTDCRVF